jgi:hypothetical protein
MRANAASIARSSDRRTWGAFKTFRALRHRDFRLLWVGLAVSAIGTWMQIVAQSLLVLKITQGSALALGTVSLAQALQRLLKNWELRQQCRIHALASLVAPSEAAPNRQPRIHGECKVESRNSPLSTAFRDSRLPLYRCSYSSPPV